jgi:opacity protein-like surface antigen
VGDALTVKSIPVTLTGRLYLPSPSSLTPFLLAGAGWYRVFYDFSPELENQFGFRDTWVSTFGWHLGAGAKLALAPPLSLYGEGRYVFADPKRKLGDDVQNQIRNLDYNSIYVAAGVSMGF